MSRLQLDETPPPSRRGREHRERENRLELPPWLVQALAALALPLWLWVIDLSQDRARTELRLEQLEKTAAKYEEAMSTLTRIDTSLGFALARLGIPTPTNPHPKSPTP